MSESDYYERTRDWLVYQPMFSMSARRLANWKLNRATQGKAYTEKNYGVSRAWTYYGTEGPSATIPLEYSFSSVRSNPQLTFDEEVLLRPEGQQTKLEICGPKDLLQKTATKTNPLYFVTLEEGRSQEEIIADEGRGIYGIFGDTFTYSSKKDFGTRNLPVFNALLDNMRSNGHLSIDFMVCRPIGPFTHDYLQNYGFGTLLGDTLLKYLSILSPTGTAYLQLPKAMFYSEENHELSNLYERWLSRFLQKNGFEITYGTSTYVVQYNNHDLERSERVARINHLP